MVAAKQRVVRHGKHQKRIAGIKSVISRKKKSKMAQVNVWAVDGERKR